MAACPDPLVSARQFLKDLADRSLQEKSERLKTYTSRLRDAISVTTHLQKAYAETLAAEQALLDASEPAKPAKKRSQRLELLWALVHNGASVKKAALACLALSGREMRTKDIERYLDRAEMQTPHTPDRIRTALWPLTQPEGPLTCERGVYQFKDAAQRNAKREELKEEARLFE